MAFCFLFFSFFLPFFLVFISWKLSMWQTAQRGRNAPSGGWLTRLPKQTNTAILLSSQLWLFVSVFCSFICHASHTEVGIIASGLRAVLLLGWEPRDLGHLCAISFELGDWGRLRLPPPLTFSTAIQLLVLNEAFPKRKTGKQKTRVLPFKQLLSKFFIRAQLYGEGAF